jgi:hypothetical protein
MQGTGGGRPQDPDRHDDASLRHALAEQLELHEEFKAARPRPPMPRSSR